MQKFLDTIIHSYAAVLAMIALQLWIKLTTAHQ